MSNFTPGPWLITEATNNQEYEVLDWWLRTICFVKGKPENAVLIAAAPELLEALENLERTAGLPAMVNNPSRVAARAAIAKAKGETK